MMTPAEFINAPHSRDDRSNSLESARNLPETQVARLDHPGGGHEARFFHLATVFWLIP